MVHSLYNYSLKVLRIVDGDTLYGEVDLGFNIRVREYVRLWDINAPETYGVKAKIEGPAGKLAIEYVDLWLQNRENEFGSVEAIPTVVPYQQVILDSRKYDAREKYGRSLGVIYKTSTDESLNDALIRMKLAVSM